jgi:uncharacterized protein (DUF58 family)
MLHPSPRALRLALVGLGLALAVALGPPALWTVWAAFWLGYAALLAADALLCAHPSELTVAIALPDTLPVGAPCAAALDIHSSSPRASRGLALDLGLALSAHFEPVAPFAAASTGADLHAPLTLWPLRRGPASVEALWLRWQGPLGLVRRTHRRQLAAQTRAVPNLARVRDAASGLATDLAPRAGARVERVLGDGSEFDRLVEFVRGLDRRSIDWKASARHARLLSRRHRAERNQQVVLAVDTGRLMGEPTAGLTRLDHAIHAALALAWVGLESGDRVGLFAFDERPRAWLAPRSGRQAFQAVSHASGALEYTTAETNFTLGLTELATRLERRSLIVVLTDFVDAVAAELMVQNLGRLAKRHLVIFVALTDTSLDALVTSPPAGLDDVHRAVIAETLRQDRERVLRRLGRAGILSVEAPPDRVSPALVQRYLRVKRRELI